LAKSIGADMLIILTAVEKVYINYNQENQQALDKLTLEEARMYIKQNQFAPGSMLPKIEACIDFVESKKEAKAIITSLEKAKDALNGYTGTCIVNK
ncbi:MAG: carbamate kinase, partial [Peptostreptococcaceae bacterium]